MREKERDKKEREKERQGGEGIKKRLRKIKEKSKRDIYNSMK